MNFEWQILSIDDVAEIIGGGTPSTKDDSNFNGDIPWITPKDLSGYTCRYITHGERNISKKGLQSSSARLLPPGTILLTTRAPVGYVAIATNPVATNQGFRNLVLKDGFLPEFFYYLLKSNTEYLKSHASGTTFGELSGSTLKRLKFLIPPLAEQRAIAHILGTLDDKIELNRKMNQTLEATAQAIFKSWFVDFDPVHAKAEGHDLGLPPHIVDLFPDRFEDSELGQIPAGWETKALDQVANFLNGLALQKYPPMDHCYLPVIKIAEMRRGTTEKSDKACTSIPNEYIVNDGDVLFSWSGSLGVCIWFGGKGALNQHLFKVTSVVYPKWFYYFWLKHYLPEFQAIASDKATTMGHIQRHHLRNALVAIPPKHLLNKIDGILSPFFNSIINVNLESRKLSCLRDILLPKLISGEIRIKDAEKFLEL